MMKQEILNKTFSGYEPCQMVKRRKSKRFEDHLCPRLQITDQWPEDEDRDLQITDQWPEDEDRDGHRNVGFFFA